MTRVLLLALILASLIASSRTEERAYTSVSEPTWRDGTGSVMRDASLDSLAVRRHGSVPGRLAHSAGRLSGTATWYCGGGSPCTRGYFPSDYIAAVDPGLGIPRGTLLTVRHGDRTVLVRAVDTCQCAGARILDLSRVAFSRLADPSAGVISVRVTVGAPSLPNTDTLP